MAASRTNKPLMSTADFARLRKFLALTASEADGEALTAVRMANAVLARTKVHWFDLMDAVEHNQPRAASPVTARRRTSAAEEIDEAFDLVLATSRGSFRDFILNLLEQWQESGSLSPKQRAALLKAAQRARGEDV